MSFYPYTYEAAAEFFEGARDKYRGRPIQNNTRLIQTSAFDVWGAALVEAYAVRLHNTNVVTYLPSGNIKLNTGGWYTVTTQDRINGWSPARVYSDFDWLPDGTKGSHGYKRWVVASHTLGTTDPKIQRCRRCRGKGTKDREVHGRWEPGVRGQYMRLDPPEIVTEKCWGCDGSGQRDYGSHKIHPAFYNGIIVDQDGQVVSKLAA